MRTHKPDLVRPSDTVFNATNKQFGVPTLRDLMREIDQLKRNQAVLQSTLSAITIPSGQDLLDELGLQTDPLSNIDFKFAQPVFARALKGSVTATVITSTSGTTVTSANTSDRLIGGVPYLCFGVGKINANADPTGFIISLIRMEATGTSEEGERTGTAAGERGLSAPATARIIWGNDTTINFAVRAKVDTGTGSVNDASVWGICLPLNVMAFREVL
jgi:hypothetical protein